MVLKFSGRRKEINRRERGRGRPKAECKLVSRTFKRNMTRETDCHLVNIVLGKAAGAKRCPKT